MAVEVKQILYTCVSRRTDNAIVAQRVHISTALDYLDYTRRVLSSPGWAAVATDKLTLSDATNSFFVLILPDGLVFIAITTKEYPTRYIYDSADGRIAGFLGGTWSHSNERFLQNRGRFRTPRNLCSLLRYVCVFSPSP